MRNFVSNTSFAIILMGKMEILFYCCLVIVVWLFLRLQFVTNVYIDKFAGTNVWDSRQLDTLVSIIFVKMFDIFL